MSSITASFPKAGAKVQLIQITASLQTFFFDTFLNFFRKSLIYKYVLQQDFQRRNAQDETTTHYNILGAWARAVQLQLQVSSMRTKQENSDLGRGKRWFKEEKTVFFP